ncbi:hypothetical protein ACFL0I_05775, partial [Gemmatimonadota bacterium]
AVNDTLSPGKVLKIDGRDATILSSDGALEDGVGWQAHRLLSTSDPLWSRAVTEATWEVYQWRTAEEGGPEFSCFYVVPVSRGGEYWTRANVFLGSEPSSMVVEGKVRGYSLHRGTAFESPFSVEGLVLHVSGLTRAGVSHQEGEVHPVTGEPIPEGVPICEVF